MLRAKNKFLFSAFSALLLTVSLFNSCKNDLDVNANYKNVLVCYGILNPYDTVQYVRVDKVFLGEGNVIFSAQVNDSMSFAPGRLLVTIEQWNGGQHINTYQLYPDTTISRDSGMFSSPYQVLYRGTFPVLKDGSIYKITVTDLLKGTTVTAETKIPKDVAVINPVSINSPLNLWDTTLFSIKFKTGENGFRYRTYLRFHYTEQFVFDTTESTEKYVDWDFGEQDAGSTAGNVQLSISFRRHTFFDHLANTIPADPLVRRISGKIDLYFVGATDELANYVDVGSTNANSITPVPFYTNITGGYGIFAARNTTFSSGYWLDQNTVYYIHVDPEMQPLNFVR